MDNSVIAHIVIAIIGWFCLFCGFIAFVWLFFIRKQIAELREQNHKLEKTLSRLHHDIHNNRSETPKADVITIESEERAGGASARAGDISPPTPSPIRLIVPVVPFAPPAPTQSAAPPAHDSGWRFRAAEDSDTQPPRTTADWSSPKKADNSVGAPFNWELFIGQKLFGWVAVVGFIVAAALLIQYSISMGWFTNSLKVIAIATFGAVLLGVGFYSRRIGLRRFSTMMSSAGVIIIYLAGYASYGIYRLVEFPTASVLMPLIVLGGFLLAWFYRSKLLGTVTIFGGLAVPILVSSGEDHYREFFIYLLALNIGTLVLVNLLRRAPIAWIAFFGTQALFGQWYGEFLGRYFYPEDTYPVHKLAAALIFQSTFYLVFLLDTAITAVKPIGKRLRPTWDDAMRAVLAPIVFFGAIFFMSIAGGVRIGVLGDGGYLAVHPSQKFLYDWMGIFAFIGAAWYALLAVCYSRHLAFVVGRRPPGGRLPTLTYWHAAPSAAVVIALGFVAIGIPLQFDAMWITLGWLTVFAGLWFFGSRQKDKTFITMAYLFFALGMVRFIAEIGDQLNAVRTPLDITPVFNSVALPMLACAGVLIVAAVLVGRINNWFNHFFGIFGYVLLGVVLSGEGTRYIYGQENLWTPYQSSYLLAAFLLGFWFLLAVFLLQIGFTFRSKVITGAACVGLVLAVVAMFFHGFPLRCEYREAFNNPFSIVLIAQSIILLVIGFQGKFVNRHSREGGNQDERLCSLDPRLRGGDVAGMPFSQFQNIFGGFGVVGLFTLLAILTIEWFNYLAPDLGEIPTLRSVTILWTFYAVFWLAPRVSAQSLPLRICGMIVLFGALVKTMFFDSCVSCGYCSWEWRAEWSLENWIPLANPYFLTMLAPVTFAIAGAVSVHQHQNPPYIGAGERTAWKVAGIIGLAALLIYLSVECYQYFESLKSKYVLFGLEHKFVGMASLTLLWTIAALILTTLALCFKSKTLRIMSMFLLGFTALKILFDLEVRPEFIVPFWNPYSLPMFVFAAVLIALACFWLYRLPEHSVERKIYRFLALAAVIFLWFTLTIECFRSVRLLTGAEEQAWQAQMALSILWSVFAGILIAIGFIWRSPTLRWLAILLFAMTLGKIVIVDMSGVNELYRFGAVIALATLLALAAWAYQRFKPEK